MAKSTAHPNIALIKYWGKEDPTLNLPASPSLSLTLSGLKTSTSVRLDPKLKQDVFILNGKKIESPKISTFMNKVRELAECQTFSVIETRNNFPTSAGHASSASGFAALSVACSQEYKLNLNHDQLSRLARIGSGSATRSIDEGLVAWQCGTDKTSFGTSIVSSDQIPLVVLSFTNDKSPKKISSTKAMEIVKKTSPYYDSWIKRSTADFRDALELVKNSDWQNLLALGEANSLGMHAATIAAKPSIIYFSPDSLKLMDQVRKIRAEKKLPIYFSLDAGPNVKVFTLKDKLAAVEKEFKDWDYTLSFPGEGAKLID
ncbi:diphosphomevalonate decarboxylase [Xylocopilactobacillus apis]|uniref:diphosphomevalonate decarboxylase n=1 Tax=Xylocopilactobacillus apis TaxID=2932183 RepID=A0AAU9DDR4_9LACO|nr:diphosphomevalonate decarboxylase [Xylocopilactobacillus apis]BDR56296.1 diphosphomevalonate decarboxylase [Xylocopilactobacillus apis]